MNRYTFAKFSSEKKSPGCLNSFHSCRKVEMIYSDSLELNKKLYTCKIKPILFQGSNDMVVRTISSVNELDIKFLDGITHSFLMNL